MADNLEVTAGTGTTIAADDIGGVLFQRIKLGLGADGTAVDAVAGAGNVGTGVQRMTLAADDPAVSALGATGDAAATQGSTGSISAKLRTVTAQLNTLAGYLDGVETALASLALESGGNLAAAASSLNVMDDWDNAASDGASISGDVAHDAADAGEPVKIGAKATNSVSALTLVANNDRTNLWAGIDGVPIVRPHTNLEDIVTGTAAITDGSSTSVISAAGTGIKVYVTSVVIANSSVTDVTVGLRDGAAGTTKVTVPVPGNSAGGVGGFTHSFPVPIPFSADTAVCADPSAAASTVTVTLIGFKSKV